MDMHKHIAALVHLADVVYVKQPELSVGPQTNGKEDGGALPSESDGAAKPANAESADDVAKPTSGDSSGDDADDASANEAHAHDDDDDGQ